MRNSFFNHLSTKTILQVIILILLCSFQQVASTSQQAIEVENFFVSRSNSLSGSTAFYKFEFFFPKVCHSNPSTSTCLPRPGSVVEFEFPPNFDDLMLGYHTSGPTALTFVSGLVSQANVITIDQNEHLRLVEIESLLKNNAVPEQTPRSHFWGVSRRIRIRLPQYTPSDLSAFRGNSVYLQFEFKLKNPKAYSLTEEESLCHTPVTFGSGYDTSPALLLPISTKDYRVRIYEEQTANALVNIIKASTNVDGLSLIQMGHPLPLKVLGNSKPDYEVFGNDIIWPTISYPSSLQVSLLESSWKQYSGSFVTFKFASGSRTFVPKYSQIEIKIPYENPRFSIGSASIVRETASYNLPLRFELRGVYRFSLEEGNVKEITMPFSVKIFISNLDGGAFETNDVSMGLLSPGGQPLWMRQPTPASWVRAPTFISSKWECSNCVSGEFAQIRIHNKFDSLSIPLKAYIFIPNALSVELNGVAPSCESTSSWQYIQGSSSATKVVFLSTGSPQAEIDVRCSLKLPGSQMFFPERFFVVEIRAADQPVIVVADAPYSLNEYYIRSQVSLSSNDLQVKGAYPKAGAQIFDPHYAFTWPTNAYALDTLLEVTIIAPGDLKPGGSTDFKIDGSIRTFYPTCTGASCVYSNLNWRPSRGSSVRLKLSLGTYPSSQSQGSVIVRDSFGELFTFPITIPASPQLYPTVKARIGSLLRPSGSPMAPPLIFELRSGSYLVAETFCEVGLPSETGFSYGFGMAPTLVSAKVFDLEDTVNDDRFLDTTPGSNLSLSVKKVNGILNVTFPNIPKVATNRLKYIQVDVQTVDSASGNIAVPQFPYFRNSPLTLTCNHQHLIALSQVLSPSAPSVTVTNEPLINILVTSTSPFALKLTSMWELQMEPHINNAAQNDKQAKIELRGIGSHFGHNLVPGNIQVTIENSNGNCWEQALYSLSTANSGTLIVQTNDNCPITPGAILKFAVQGMVNGGPNAPPVIGSLVYIRSGETSKPITFEMPRSLTIPLVGSSMRMNLNPTELEGKLLPVPLAPVIVEMNLFIPEEVKSALENDPLRWELFITFPEEFIPLDENSDMLSSIPSITKFLKIINEGNGNDSEVEVISYELVNVDAVTVLIKLPEDTSLPVNYKLEFTGLIVPQSPRLWRDAIFIARVKAQGDTKVLGEIEMRNRDFMPNFANAWTRAAALGPIHIRDISSSVGHRMAEIMPRPVPFNAASRVTEADVNGHFTKLGFRLPPTSLYQGRISVSNPDFFMYLSVPLATLRDPLSHDWKDLSKYPLKGSEVEAKPLPRQGDLTNMYTWSNVSSSSSIDGVVWFEIMLAETNADVFTSTKQSVPSQDVRCAIVPQLAMMRRFELTPMAICAVKLPICSFIVEGTSLCGKSFSKKQLLKALGQTGIVEADYNVNFNIQLNGFPRQPSEAPTPFAPWTVRAEFSSTKPEHQGYPVRDVELESPMEVKSEKAFAYDMLYEEPKEPIEDEITYLKSSEAQGKVFSSGIDFPMNLLTSPTQSSISVEVSAKTALDVFSLNLKLYLPHDAMPLAGGEFIRVKLPKFYAIQLWEQSQSPKQFMEPLLLASLNSANPLELLNWMMGDRPASVELLVDNTVIQTGDIRSVSQTELRSRHFLMAKASRSGDVLPLDQNGAPIGNAQLQETIPDTLTIELPVRISGTQLENVNQIRISITLLQHPPAEITQLTEAQMHNFYVTLHPPARFIARAIVLSQALPQPIGEDKHPNPVVIQFPPIKLLLSNPDDVLSELSLPSSFANQGKPIWTKNGLSRVFTANEYEIELKIPFSIVRSFRILKAISAESQQQAHHIDVLPYLFVVEFDRPTLLNSIEAVSLVIPHTTQGFEGAVSFYDVTSNEVKMSRPSQGEGGKSLDSSVTKIRVPVREEFFTHLLSIVNESTYTITIKIVLHRVRLSQIPQPNALLEEIKMHPRLMSQARNAMDPNGPNVFLALLNVKGKYAYGSYPICLTNAVSIGNLITSPVPFLQGSSFMAVPIDSRGLSREEILSLDPNTPLANLPPKELSEGIPVAIQTVAIWPLNSESLFDPFSDEIIVELPRGWIANGQSSSMTARFAIVGGTPLSPQIPEFLPGRLEPALLEITNVESTFNADLITLRVKLPHPAQKSVGEPIVGLPELSVGWNGPDYRFSRFMNGFPNISQGMKFMVRFGPLPYPGTVAPRGPVRTILASTELKSGTGFMPDPIAHPLLKAYLGSSTHFGPSEAGEIPRRISLNYASPILPSHVLVSLGSTISQSRTNMDFVLRIPPVFLTEGAFSDISYSKEIVIPLHSDAEFAAVRTTTTLNNRLAQSTSVKGFTSTSDERMLEKQLSPVGQWEEWGTVYSAKVSESPISIGEASLNIPGSETFIRAPPTLNRIAVVLPNSFIEHFNNLVQLSLNLQTNAEILIFLRLKTVLLPSAKDSRASLESTASPLISLSHLNVMKSLRYSDTAPVTAIGSASLSLPPLTIPKFFGTSKITLSRSAAQSNSDTPVSDTLPYSDVPVSALCTITLPNSFDLRADKGYVLRVSLPRSVIYLQTGDDATQQSLTHLQLIVKENAVSTPISLSLPVSFEKSTEFSRSFFSIVLNRDIPKGSTLEIALPNLLMPTYEQIILDPLARVSIRAPTQEFSISSSNYNFNLNTISVLAENVMWPNAIGKKLPLVRMSKISTFLKSSKQNSLLITLESTSEPFRENSVLKLVFPVGFDFSSADPAIRLIKLDNTVENSPPITEIVPGSHEESVCFAILPTKEGSPNNLQTISIILGTKQNAKLRIALIIKGYTTSSSLLNLGLESVKITVESVDGYPLIGQSPVSQYTTLSAGVKETIESLASLEEDEALKGVPGSASKWMRTNILNIPSMLSELELSFSGISPSSVADAYIAFKLPTSSTWKIPAGATIHLHFPSEFNLQLSSEIGGLEVPNILAQPSDVKIGFYVGSAPHYIGNWNRDPFTLVLPTVPTPSVLIAAKAVSFSNSLSDTTINQYVGEIYSATRRFYTNSALEREYHARTTLSITLPTAGTDASKLESVASSVHGVTILIPRLKLGPIGSRMGKRFPFYVALSEPYRSNRVDLPQLYRSSSISALSATVGESDPFSYEYAVTVSTCTLDPVVGLWTNYSGIAITFLDTIALANTWTQYEAVEQSLEKLKSQVKDNLALHSSITFPCENVVSKPTLMRLGRDPKCVIRGDRKAIWITFGRDATMLPNDLEVPNLGLFESFTFRSGGLARRTFLPNGSFSDSLFIADIGCGMKRMVNRPQADSPSPLPSSALGLISVSVQPLFQSFAICEAMRSTAAQVVNSGSRGVAYSFDLTICPNGMECNPLRVYLNALNIEVQKVNLKRLEIIRNSMHSQNGVITRAELQKLIDNIFDSIQFDQSAVDAGLTTAIVKYGARGSLQLPLSMTLNGGKYTIKVRATTWFGTTSETDLVFTRISTNPPKIFAISSSDDSYTIKNSLSTTIGFRTEPGTCSNEAGSSKPKLNHVWKSTPVFDSAVMPLAVSALAQAQGKKEIHFLRYTFPVGFSFTLRLTVIDTMTNEESFSEMNFLVSSSPLTAHIAGGMRRKAPLPATMSDLSVDVLLLDGTQSGDPDVDNSLLDQKQRYITKTSSPPTLSAIAIDHMKHLLFEWKCFVGLTSENSGSLSSQIQEVTLLDGPILCPISEISSTNHVEPPALSGVGHKFSVLKLKRGHMAIPDDPRKVWVFELHVSDTSQARSAISTRVVIAFSEFDIPEVSIDLLSPTGAPIDPGAMPLHYSLNLAARVAWRGETLPMGSSKIEKVSSHVDNVTGKTYRVTTVTNFKFLWSVIEDNLPGFTPDESGFSIRRTDLTAPYLVLQPKSLSPGYSYRFSVTVTATSNDYTVFASQSGDHEEKQLMTFVGSSQDVSLLSWSNFAQTLSSIGDFEPQNDQRHLGKEVFNANASQVNKEIPPNSYDSTVLTSLQHGGISRKLQRPTTQLYQYTDDSDESSSAAGAGADFAIVTHTPPIEGECLVQPENFDVKMIANPLYQSSPEQANNDVNQINPNIPPNLYPFGTPFIISCNGWKASDSPVSAANPLEYRFAIRVPSPVTKTSKDETSTNYNDAAALPKGFIPLGSSFQLSNSITTRIAGSYESNVEILVHIRDQVGGVTVVELNVPVAPVNPEEIGGLNSPIVQSLFEEMESSVSAGDSVTFVASTQLVSQIISALKPPLNPHLIIESGVNPQIVQAYENIVKALEDFLIMMTPSPYSADMIFSVLSSVTLDPIYLSPTAQLKSAPLLANALQMYTSQSATLTPESTGQLLESLSGILTASSLSAFLGQGGDGQREIGIALTNILNSLCGALLQGAVPDVSPIVVETSSIKIVALRRSLNALDTAHSQGEANRVSILSKWAEENEQVEAIEGAVLVNYTLGHMADPQDQSQFDLTYPTSALNQFRNAFTPDTAIDVLVSVVNNNIFAFKDNYTQEISSSQLLSLTLYPSSIADGKTGSAFKFNNVEEPFKLAIPHKASTVKEYSDAAAFAAQLQAQRPDAFTNGTYVPHISHVCRFWDETNLEWSTQGCEVDLVASSEHMTICKCTHLTIFNVALSVLPRFIPHVNVFGVNDIKNVTWENIQKYPAPFISIMVVLGLTVLFYPFAFYRDQAIERELIYSTLDTFKTMHQEGLAYPPRQEIRKDLKNKEVMNSSKSKMKFVLMNGLREHLWTSIYFRSKTSAFQSRERLLVVSGLILVTLTLSAVFLGNQSSQQMVTVAFLTALATGAVTGVVASLFIGETPALSWLLGFFLRQYAMYRLIEMKHVSHQYQAAISAFHEYYRVQVARRRGEPDDLQGREPVTPFAIAAVLGESIRKGTTLGYDVTLAPTVNEVVTEGSPMHPIKKQKPTSKSLQTKKAEKVLGESADKTSLVLQMKVRDELNVAKTVVLDKTVHLTTPVSLLQRDIEQNVNSKGEAQIVPLEEFDESEIAALEEFSRVTQRRFEDAWKENWESILKENVNQPLFEEMTSCTNKCCFRFRGFMLHSLVDKYQDGITLELILRCMYSSAFWTMVDRFPREAIAHAFLNRPLRDRWPIRRIFAYTCAVLVIMGAAFLVLVYGMKFDMEGKISSATWITGVAYTNIIDIFGTKPFSLVCELAVIILFYYFWCMPTIKSYADKEKDLMANVLKSRVSGFAEDLARDPLISPLVAKRIVRTIPVEYRKPFSHKLKESVDMEFAERVKVYRQEKQASRLRFILKGYTDRIGDQHSVIEDRIYTEAKATGKTVYDIAKKIKLKAALEIASEDKTLDDIDTDIEDESKSDHYDLRRSADKLQLRLNRFFKRVRALSQTFKHRKPTKDGKSDGNTLYSEASKQSSKVDRDVSEKQEERSITGGSEVSKKSKITFIEGIDVKTNVDSAESVSQKSKVKKKAVTYDDPEDSDDDTNQAETSVFDPILNMHQPSLEDSRKKLASKLATVDLLQSVGLQYEFEDVVVDNSVEQEDSHVDLNDVTIAIQKSRKKNVDLAEKKQMEPESRRTHFANTNRRTSITGDMLNAILSAQDWDPDENEIVRKAGKNGDDDEDDDVEDDSYLNKRPISTKKQVPVELSESQIHALERLKKEPINGESSSDDDDNIESLPVQTEAQRKKKLPPGVAQNSDDLKPLNLLKNAMHDEVHLGIAESEKRPPNGNSLTKARLLTKPKPLNQISEIELEPLQQRSPAPRGENHKLNEEVKYASAPISETKNSYPKAVSNPFKNLEKENGLKSVPKSDRKVILKFSSKGPEMSVQANEQKTPTFIKTRKNPTKQQKNN